jgi:DNA-binding MarR family transcriptional regulator
MKNLSQPTIGLLIGRASQRLQEVVAQRVAAYRITPQQLWVLLLVLEGADMSSRDIVARLHIDKAATSRLMDRLVRRRWIRMVPTKDDRRRRRLELTPSGLRQAKELKRLALEIDRNMEAAIPPEHFELVNSALLQVGTRLEAMQAEAAAKTPSMKKSAKPGR